MSRSHTDREWVVTQIGARQHYAVARAIHAEGRLRQLYTDAWCSRGHAVFRALPDPFRSFANRHHPGLPKEAVTAFNLQAFKHRINWKLLPSDSDAARYQHHVEVGRAFGNDVRRDLKRQGVAPDDLIFFGYDTGCLEVLEWFQGTDGLAIVDQIDPGRVEKKIVLDEIEQWPGWATKAPVLHPPHYERIEAEWDLASVIMVNSEWSRDALVQQGVPSSKIEIIPIAYEPSDDRSVSPSGSSPGGPFRVLWLGSVILRKGIQYLVEAARHLPTDSLQIDVVGPLGITDEAVQSAPSNMTFHGRVPRDEVTEWYRQSDVFVLPTLSDGFAITQLEAMANGLPVIATSRCGKVVEDGVNGRIVPAQDADALARAIDDLAAHPERLRTMKSRAQSTVQDYHPSVVVDQLLDMSRKRIKKVASDARS